MSDLLQKLYFMRDLLQTMVRLTNEEQEIRKQAKAIMPSKALISKPKYSRVNTAIILVFIAAIVFVISTSFCIQGIYRDRRTQYSIEETKNELQWAMGHLSIDTRYPGYDVPRPQIEEFKEEGAVCGILIVAVVTGVVAVSIPWLRKWRSRSIDIKNIRIEEDNRQIAVQNQQIQEHNNRLSQELERIHGELIRYQQEFERNAEAWFPRNYATYDALEFFIRQAENHMVDTMPQAVILYEQELKHREMRDIYKQQTDAMIKQQKLTNILQLANTVINLSTNVAVRQNLDISRDTNAVARRNASTNNAIYAETQRIASYVGDINRKLK